MAQEAQIITEVVAWKHLLLMYCGYVIRILWHWQVPIPWMRISAGLLLIGVSHYFVTKWIDPVYQYEMGLLVGLFTNNIIQGLFRLAKVNEDEMAGRLERWWRSDEKNSNSNK